MTTEQKQCLLKYLGYYGGPVDGIWGEQSRKATEDFQNAFGGIKVDGDPGPETQKAMKHAVAYDMLKVEDVPEADTGNTTGTFWTKIKYFKRSDPGIACPCGRCGGFPVEPVERLMLNADAAREHFGKPAIPSSTVRCAAHNAELPGSAANSLHMRGKAMDFCIQGVSSGVLLVYVKTLPNVDEAYAIDDSFVHMGVLKY